MNNPANSSDEELVNSLSESGDQAIAELAERYAQPLYDFALRLTLDIDAAADILFAGFEHLRSRADQRPSGMSVRGFLFNFAFEQGLDVANDRDRPTTARLSTGDRRFTQTPAGADREAALWAWQAARSLRPRDYGVVDLTARRGINPDEITGSAVQGRGGIYTILSRASAAFAEAYVATALYFRGRDACSDLTELAGGGGAAMRVGIRRQIASHVEDCETCQATLEALPNASDVFRDLHDVEPPAELAARFAAGMAAGAALAGGQLSLDDTPADEAVTTGASEEEPDESLADTAPPQIEEQPWADDDTPTVESPVSEGELWARPADSPSWPETASAALQDALAGMEQRYSVEPAFQPEQPEVYEHYGGEYAPEPYRSPYAAPPLTLGERLSTWFAPAYGRSFLWSYALLGVATAVAIYLGIAVADSLSGGGSGALPAGGDGDVVREIACDSAPLSVESGSSQVFEFDPEGLNGFELSSVVVTDRPVDAGTRSLLVEAGGATTVMAEAAPVFSPAARSDEYSLQILWQRDGEDAVTDCPLLVHVPASAGASPTPQATETTEADATPGDGATPEPTP